MKTFISILTALLMFPLGVMGQELPQFAYNDFEGWTYNGGELTSSNIGNWRITLYVTKKNVALMLTSPEFSCQGIDSIRADVSWKSLSIDVPLTMAIDDAEGTPLDSVSCYPPQAITAPQTLTLTLAVPDGLTTARLRFVSWEANVNNGGATNKIVLTGLSSGTPTVVQGDVDGDGRVNISDVTALINYLLGGDDSIDPAVADTDNDGRVNISDVTALINMLLSGTV